jgi:uncharacterized Zn finger protein
VSRGSWSRRLVAVVGGGPGDVAALRVEPGAVSGQVDGCRAVLLAPLVPEGVWAAVVGFARNRSALRSGIEGAAQSEALEHLLAEDWEEPLVPDADAIARVCECDDGGDCEHVAALVSAFADAIDADASVLLRWRGCVEDAELPADAWTGAALAPPAPPRAYPAGAVLMRLGESGIRAGDGDLADALAAAYDAFAET